MARGLNRITLIGNLGDDPKLQYTADGIAVANASLAVNGFRRDSETAERAESVEWFRLVFWDRQAETISTYGKKGKPIFVEGRLQTRPYADRNGVIRTAVEVVISQFLLLGSAAPAVEDADTPEPPAEMAATS
jgi:single-strand DNA-binding protein